MEVMRTPVRLESSENSDYGPSLHRELRFNIPTDIPRDESSTITRTACVYLSSSKPDNGDDGKHRDGINIQHSSVEGKIQTDPETRGGQLSDLAPMSGISSTHLADSQLSVNAQSSVCESQDRHLHGPIVRHAPHDRLSVLEVNFKAIAQGTKPEHAECFGALVDEMPITKLKMWNIVGSLSTAWTDDIHPKLRDLLQDNWHRLMKHQPATGAPIYALRAYLIGWSTRHAAPHVAFLSSQKYESSAKNARKIALKHGLLTSHGWGPSFVCLRLQTGIIQPMLSYSFTKPYGHAGDRDVPDPLRYGDAGKLSYNASTVDRSPPPDDPEVIWPLFMLRDQVLSNTACGAIFRTSDGCEGTIGGTLAVDHDYYGLTAGHIFGQTESSERTSTIQGDDLSDNGDDCLHYNEEDMALINCVASEYNSRLNLDEMLIPPVFRVAEMAQKTSNAHDVTPGTALGQVADAVDQQASPVKHQMGSSEGVVPTVQTSTHGVDSISELTSTLEDCPFGMVSSHAISKAEGPNSRSLDWALVKLSDVRYRRRTKFYLERYSRPTFLRPSKIAEKMPADGRGLLLSANPTRSGPQSVTSTASINIGTGVYIPDAWVVRIDDLRKGECGAWILDPNDDSVLGMVVAHCPELREAYLAPLHQIIDDMKQKGYGDEIGLKLSTSSVSQPAIHSPPNWSRHHSISTTHPTRRPPLVGGHYFGSPYSGRSDSGSSYSASSSSYSSQARPRPVKITYRHGGPQGAGYWL